MLAFSRAVARRDGAGIGGRVGGEGVVKPGGLIWNLGGWAASGVKSLRKVEDEEGGEGVWTRGTDLRPIEVPGRLGVVGMGGGVWR